MTPVNYTLVYFFQMVASSLQAAINLIQLCRGREEYNAVGRIEVLIGKGEIHILSKEEQLIIARCLEHNGFGGDLDVYLVEGYRSALIQANGFLHAGGTNYQIGDVAFAKHKNDCVIKILHLYLLKLQHQYIHILIGDSYKVSKDMVNNELRHPFSDTAIVEPFATNTCIYLENVMRKIMMHPYQAGKFAVIDPTRPQIPLPEVLVPLFPQVGDMVLVKGDREELWRAEVRFVDQEAHIVQGYFYIKHQHWQENFLWIRESQGRRLDRIMFQSIVGIVNGQWYGSAWKDITNQV